MSLDAQRNALQILNDRHKKSNHYLSKSDICYSRKRENLLRIAEALRPFNPRLRGFPKELPFVWDASTLLNGTNFTFDTTLGDFDMLGEVSGIGAFEDVLRLSEKWTI